MEISTPNHYNWIGAADGTINAGSTDDAGEGSNADDGSIVIPGVFAMMIGIAPGIAIGDV